jgi:hypothetical protein
MRRGDTRRAPPCRRRRGQEEASVPSTEAPQSTIQWEGAVELAGRPASTNTQQGEHRHRRAEEEVGSVEREEAATSGIFFKQKASCPALYIKPHGKHPAITIRGTLKIHTQEIATRIHPDLTTIAS